MTRALAAVRILLLAAVLSGPLARASAGGAEHSAVSGDASEPAVLIQAHAARASLLVIATPDTLETARMLNPRIGILLRTHTDEEAELLRQENLGRVFMGEHELMMPFSQTKARSVPSTFLQPTAWRGSTFSHYRTSTA